jgi:hypothetical protein
MLWERDIAKSGKPVADRWLAAMRTWTHCDGSPSNATHGMIEDFQMPIRVDCDCNVWITCCDGTEKQLLTKDQVEALLLGQPGAGSSQPPPGGGCQVYHGEMQAAGRWLVPTVVSTGDTIAINNAVGAGTDGIGVRWFCPDGVQFFAGVCVGSTTTDGADPLPASPHMSLIIEIDGTFYFPGSSFTVPGGISNEQIFVQLNDGDLADNSGSYTFDVEVCNNQAAAWTLPQNLSLNPGGWNTDIPTTSGTQSTWNSGVGWQQVDCDNTFGGAGRYNWVYIKLTFDHPTTLTHMDITYDSVVGDLADGGGDRIYSIVGGVPSVIASQASANGTNRTLVFNGSIPSCQGVYVLLYGSDHSDGSCPPTGSATLKAANLSGVGVAPF